MAGSNSMPPGLIDSAAQWWKDIAERDGRLVASKKLLSALWGFARNSTPARLRQRYGDMDYDWQHRVNTTSAAVGWRDRLLGVFHSPYQPTDEELFHEMLAFLRENMQSEFEDFLFVDLGSGKGRTLLMASDYCFRRVMGLELLPTLQSLAEENIGRYKSDSQKCFSLESICADATQFLFPPEPTVVYLFNPFPEPGLRRVIANLKRSLVDHPRPVFVLYHNPLLENVLVSSSVLRKIGGSHQYSLYAADLSSEPCRARQSTH